MDFFANLFSSEFMPHGHCYQWRPDILWTHVISDGLITFSYATIPATLAMFTAKRKDLEFRGIFLLFAAFILCCGATHALEIYSVWEGAYRLTGLMKAVTAVISLATAVALIIMVPKALLIPSPQQLHEANIELRKESQQRLKVEAELSQQRKEQLFRTIVSAIPSGMLLLDKAGRVLLANRAVSRIFGLGDVEPTGTLVDAVLPNAFLSGFHEKLKLFFESEGGESAFSGVVFEGAREDGQTLVSKMGFTPIRWKNEDLVIVNIVDITDSVRQNEAIRRSNNRFDRAVAGTAEGLWEWDVLSEQVWYSPQFFKLLAYEERAGGALDFWLDHTDHSSRARLEHSLRGLSETEGEFQQEHRLRLRSGEYRWFLTRGRGRRDGPFHFVSGSISDIHQRKMIEMALERQNQFMETIFANIRHGIFVLDVTEDQDLIFVAFNRAEEEMTGVPFEHARNKRIEELAPEYFPLEVAQEIRARYQTCFDRKDVYEYTEMIPIKGRQTWWLTRLAPVLDQSGEVYRIIGSTSEITQIKQLEASVREREEYLQKIIDYSLNGLFIIELETLKNTFINPSFTRITGYHREDLQDEGLDFMALFHPDERAVMDEHFEDVKRAERGAMRSMEYRFRHKHGHWIWCLSSDAVFSYDDAGRPVEMIGTFIDITSIKEATQRLHDSNQELEQFAFVASHDLREPLRKVKSFAQLIKKRYADGLPEKALDYFNRMMSATERMDRLIEDLLSLSRVATHAREFTTQSLDSVLDTVLQDLDILIRRKQAVIQREPLPEIRCDEGQMYQLFTNLISNSLKYVDEQRIPAIHIRAVPESQSYVVLEFKDNGIGFDQKDAEQIFGIFKRLHGREAYPGSGIGLAICRKIVDRHNGSIRAFGLLNQGARFEIRLPIT